MAADAILGAVGQVVGAVSNVWASTVNAQAQHDALNKQSEINDKTFGYNLALAQQKQQSLKTTAIIVVIAIIVLMIAFAVIWSITHR